MRKVTMLIMANAILLAPASGLAQSADHSDRGDVADFRAHDDDILGDEPDRAEELGPGLSLSLGAMFLGDSNPAWGADGSPNALLAAPSATLALVHPSILSGWSLEASAGADADIFSRDADDLNETRLDAGVAVSHEVSRAGTLSAAFRVRRVYFGEGFRNFDHDLRRFIIGFVPRLSSKLGVSLSGEFRDSSRAEQKRVMLTATVDLPLLDNDKARLGFFQEFALSRYTAGDNDGRDDLLALSEVTLSPKLDLQEGMRVGIAAIFFHRFSNRAASRATGIQVGPTINFDF